MRNESLISNTLALLASALLDSALRASALSVSALLDSALLASALSVSALSVSALLALALSVSALLASALVASALSVSAYFNRCVRKPPFSSPTDIIMTSLAALNVFPLA